MVTLYSIKDKKKVLSELAAVYVEMEEKEAARKIAELSKSVEELLMKECNSAYCNARKFEAEQILEKPK